MADLSNKRIVVTGGSAGIGLAIVSALREAQAEVTAIARNEARLAAAREIGAHCVAGDATDATPTERDPDVLILNAGAQPAMAPIDRQTWEGFSTTWNIDVKGTLVGIQAVTQCRASRIAVFGKRDPAAW